MACRCSARRGPRAEGPARREHRAHRVAEATQASLGNISGATDIGPNERPFDAPAAPASAASSLVLRSDDALGAPILECAVHRQYRPDRGEWPAEDREHEDQA